MLMQYILYYSAILMKNLISKYEIFRGVCEDDKLTTVAKVSLFPSLRKIFRRIEIVTLRKKLKCLTVGF